MTESDFDTKAQFLEAVRNDGAILGEMEYFTNGDGSATSYKARNDDGEVEDVTKADVEAAWEEHHESEDAEDKEEEDLPDEAQWGDEDAYEEGDRVTVMYTSSRGSEVEKAGTVEGVDHMHIRVAEDRADRVLEISPSGEVRNYESARKMGTEGRVEELDESEQSPGSDHVGTFYWTKSFDDDDRAAISEALEDAGYAVGDEVGSGGFKVHVADKE